MQKSQIYTWDGKMPLRWKKMENFKLELPRETLLSVEIVQELKGEVRTGPNLNVYKNKTNGEKKDLNQI